MTGQLITDDDGDRIAVWLVDGREYSMTFEHFDEANHIWALSVIGRHIQEAHDRAVRNTKFQFQSSMRKLIGITDDRDG